MSGQWQSIIFDDPTSRHPMLSRVVQVMQCIYYAVDPAHPPPPTVMKWWHSQSLSYQVGESGYEPSIVILNLREGRQDSTMKTHFTINLNTMTVIDKFQNRRFPAPKAIRSVLGDLEEHARRTVREKKEAEVEEARRLEEEREERRNRVQAFHRCLIDQGLVDEDRSLSSDSPYCPICLAQQTSCCKCRIISCSNSDCAASSAIPISRCFFHPSTQFCTSCLEPPPGSLPELGKCPICLRLFCSAELSWCLGRPIANSGTVGTGPSSNIDVSGITQVHPVRPLSCRSIPCMSNVQGSRRGGRQCSNASSCWSVRSSNTKVCPECITEDTFSCPCGQYWTCGSCESQSSSARRLPTCPRCDNYYCSLCSYIKSCGVCRRAGLCNDCMEEEESVGVDHTPGENLLLKCWNCKDYLCKTCADGGGEPCKSCGQDLCKLCEDEEVRNCCGVTVCTECRASDEQCNDCSRFHGRYDYDFGFFEFGSNGGMTYHNF
ncbi:hypothetical protein DFH29DRAFT_847094 [Suillus ampliporus]|nr:hypothetical protein DFH29DRAFT_847094 [Suillus ampliporus]